MSMFDDVLSNVGEPYKGNGSKGFKYGTHTVQILSAVAGQKKVKNDPTAEVITVSVAKPEDPSNIAEATLYFHTEGGAQMSVTKILGLLVHKVGEEKKDQVRALGKKLFNQIETAVEARDVAAKLINDKLIGQEGFAFADPQGKYDTTKYVDLWHYEYKDPNADDRAEKEADALIKDSEPVTDAERADMPNFDDL